MIFSTSGSRLQDGARALPLFGFLIHNNVASLPLAPLEVVSLRDRGGTLPHVTLRSLHPSAGPVPRASFPDFQQPGGGIFLAPSPVDGRHAPRKSAMLRSVAIPRFCSWALHWQAKSHSQAISSRIYRAWSRSCLPGLLRVPKVVTSANSGLGGTVSFSLLGPLWT